MSPVTLPTTARSASVLSKAAYSKGARYARIVATSHALPQRVVTNDDIIGEYGHTVSGSVMARLTGVSRRHVAERGVVDTDLLRDAAIRCLAKGDVEVDGLSKILVTKFLGDRALPMTASLLQKKLGCGVAVQGYDIDGGVHSFVHAFEAGCHLMALGNGPILLASGGVINCAVSRKDPRVAFQYGDGAAAVLLAPAERPHLLSSYSFSNHEFARLNVGFSIRHALPDDIHETKDYGRFFDLYEQGDWKPVQDFALDAMRVTSQRLLTAANKLWADVDAFLVTETHHRLWQLIVEKLDIPVERTISLLAERGNTMSAMLPMQLDEALRRGLLQPGSLVMMLSIGEGLSGGGLLLEI